MTSRRPYWCPKTMKRRPCCCSEPILWELNSFLMQTLSFFPINLHKRWPREWKRSSIDFFTLRYYWFRWSLQPMVRNWFGDDGELNLMFLNVNEAIAQKREGLWKPFYISHVKRIDPGVRFILLFFFIFVSRRLWSLVRTFSFSFFALKIKLRSWEMSQN